MTDRAPIAVETCHAAINNLAARIAARPNADAGSDDPLILNEPACSYGCDTCYMSCAIAPTRLAWWRTELLRSESHQAGFALEHAGVMFNYAAGRA